MMARTYMELERDGEIIEVTTTVRTVRGEVTDVCAETDEGEVIALSPGEEATAIARVGL